jgi:hypothetical protein
MLEPFLLGITCGPVVGPMLTVGVGGTTTDLVDDRAHCLIPPTQDDLGDRHRCVAAAS